MGFDEWLSMEAVKHNGKNMNKCINWIISNKKNVA